MHNTIVNSDPTGGGGYEMFKVIKAKYEGGALKPLEKLDLKEGEEVEIIIKDSVADKLYGIAKRRNPSITEKDLAEVIEEIENEGFL